MYKTKTDKIISCAEFSTLMDKREFDTYVTFDKILTVLDEYNNQD